MNILLCLPNTLGTAFGSTFFPLGMAYISSALKAAGHNVFVVNFFLEKRSVFEVLKQMIPKFNISVVGSGEIVTNYAPLKQIFDAAKMVSKDVITIMGGRFVTHSPKEAMTIIPSADYGIIGEGEVAICELIQAIIGGGVSLCEVEGIVYRTLDPSGREVLRLTDSRKPFSDIDTIPWPDLEGFRFFDLWRKDERIVPIVTSRSCPYKCTFCVYHKGEKYRQRSLGKIFEEISYLIERHDISQFYFMDEVFSINHKRLNDFCTEIKKYNVKWSIFMKPNKLLTKDIFIMMKDSGCTYVFLGLESADDRILHSMNKKNSVQDIEMVIRNAYEASLPISGKFIFGDVNETFDTAKTTIEWAKRNKKYLPYIHFGLIGIYPGSQLWEYAKKNGYIKDSVQYIKDYCPYINISKLSDGEYSMLVNKLLPEINFEMNDDANITPSLNFTIDQKHDGYTAEVICPHCETHNTCFIYYIDIALRKLIFCRKCKAYIIIYIFKEYINSIDMKLALLLGKYKLAFWGIGASWKRIYSYSETLQQNDKYLLIDTMKGGKGEKNCGKSILLPMDIIKNEVNFIITTAGFEADAKNIIIHEGIMHPVNLMDIGRIGLLTDA